MFYSWWFAIHSQWKNKINNPFDKNFLHRLNTSQNIFDQTIVCYRERGVHKKLMSNPCSKKTTLDCDDICKERANLFYKPIWFVGLLCQAKLSSVRASEHCFFPSFTIHHVLFSRPNEVVNKILVFNRSSDHVILPSQRIRLAWRKTFFFHIHNV